MVILIEFSPIRDLNAAMFNSSRPPILGRMIIILAIAVQSSCVSKNSNMEIIVLFIDLSDRTYYSLFIFFHLLRKLLG